MRIQTPPHTFLKLIASPLKTTERELNGPASEFTDIETLIKENLNFRGDQHLLPVFVDVFDVRKD